MDISSHREIKMHENILHYKCVVSISGFFGTQTSFLKSFDEQFLPECVEDLGLIQSAIYINLEIDLFLKSVYYNELLP